MSRDTNCDPSLIQALETRLANAWPALETQLCEGWALRFAAGYSKRANAATALLPGATLDDALIDHLVAQYRIQGITPVVRLVGIEAAETEARLAARGFREVDPSLTLLGPATPGTIPPDLAIAQTVPPEWITAAAGSYGGEKSDAARLAAIVTRIRQPAAFATLVGEGGAVAWGLAVAERGFVGLYDIVVAPNVRGQGLGRRLVGALLAWGAEAGAARAYLQVREGNAAAVRLYGSLGFRPAYRYRHRVLD